jgi:hypothetical protein
VLPAIANGRTSWVEVGNIFGETRIFAFLHGLGRKLPIDGGRYLPALLKSLGGTGPHVAYNGSGSRRSDAVGAETTGPGVSKEEK